MIYINGSILDEQPTGLGVYALNVIIQLKKYIDNYYVFSPIDIKGVNIIKITKYTKPRYKKIGGLMRFLWTQLILPLKTKKSDIIYHPFQYISFFSKSKQIITIHDLISLHYPEIARHQYYYYKMIMPLLLKRAFKIITISESTKKDIIKYYHIDGEKISVIYNGYDKSLFRRKNNPEMIAMKYNVNDKYILMIGTSYKHKNIHTIINVYKDISKILKCKLVIIGKGSKYRDKINKYVCDNGLKGDIIFLGYVKKEDLPYLYTGAECFLYPSLYEGFGLPILEAMSCGTAVLCSNTSSMPEVADNAALMFNPLNENEIKYALIQVVLNKNIRNILIKRGYENIKRFSWDRTAKSITKILTKW